MPLRSAEAFVLDTRKLREADRLVILLTEEEGKVRSVAPSAAKSRRRFGGRLERLSRVRATWFEREGAALARLDGCDLLEESFTLHQDLLMAATLAYVAEIADTFAHERESDRRFFRLIKSLMEAFRLLPAGGDTALLARYCETWTLRLHGLMPDLDRCGACGRDLAGHEAMIRGGGTEPALCARCARAAGGSPGGPLRLSAAALAALERFRRFAPADLVNVALPPAVLGEIEGFGVSVITAFVGHPMRSYRFLKETLPERAP